MNWLMWDKFRIEIFLRTLQIPILMMNEADSTQRNIHWNT